MGWAAGAETRGFRAPEAPEMDQPAGASDCLFWQGFVPRAGDLRSGHDRRASVEQGTLRPSARRTVRLLTGGEGHRRQPMPTSLQ